MPDNAGGLRPPPALHRPPGAQRAPPPGKAPPPQTYRQAGKPPSGHNRSGGGRGKSFNCCQCCCFLLVALLFLILLLALAGAFAFLYFEPRLPLFRLQELKVPRFNVDDDDDKGGTYINARTSIQMFVSNRNAKLAVTYDGGLRSAVRALDEEGDVAIGEGEMEGFEQGTKNATVLKFKQEVEELLVDAAAGERLRRGFKGKEIKFGVVVKTKMGFVHRGTLLAKLPAKIECPPVSLKDVKSDGLLPKCHVSFFNWISLG